MAEFVKRNANAPRGFYAQERLYPLLAHVALFGAGYAHQTAAATRAAAVL
jgi:hypothetical protein